MLNRLVTILFAATVIFVCHAPWLGGGPPSHLPLGKTVKCHFFSNGKQSGHEVEIRPESEIYNSLQAWLDKKRSWKTDINTYANSQIIVSDKLNLNLSGQQVVLNVSTSKGKSNQYSCKADDEIMKVFKSLRDQSMMKSLPRSTDSPPF